MLSAISGVPGRDKPGTLARPRPFACHGEGVKGGVFWLKNKAQQGFCAELIPARLARLLGVGPEGAAVQVAAEAVEPQDDATHLVDRVVFGSREIMNTENSKTLQNLMDFAPERIDHASWARVTAFRTWVGAGDPQCLVGLSDGRVHTIDHGDCFADLTAPSDIDPARHTPQLKGLALDRKVQRDPLMSTVDAIGTFSNDDLASAVSRIPQEDGWNAEFERRVQIADWLGQRRDRLPGVMDAWTR